MKLEAAYRRYLTLTGNEVAAAILAVGDCQSPRQEALSPKEAAAMLGVSTDKIYELCKSGRLRSSKIGRAVRISPDDLRDFSDDAKAA